MYCKNFFSDISSWFNNTWNKKTFYKGSNKSAHVLLNLLNDSQGPKGQKIGPVRIVCRFMVTYIKTFNGVLPLI